MTRAQLQADILNHLQICTLAQQATIDSPGNPDDVQRRAAQTQKLLHRVAAEVRELTAIDGKFEPVCDAAVAPTEGE